jgi:mono/diheme cytochrome c family protein
MSRNKLAITLTTSFIMMAGIGIVHADPVPALYTAAQATTGQAVFAQNCAMCHGAALQGGAGPALIGQAFASADNKYSVAAMFDELTQQMPAGQPGSLTHDQYAAVFAYILKENGYPAGATPLNYKASLTSTVPLVSQVK